MLPPWAYPTAALLVDWMVWMMVDEWVVGSVEKLVAA